MRLPIRIITSIASALVVALLLSTGYLAALDSLMFDALTRLRGPRPPPRNVLVVAMDEKSYADLSIRLDEAWPRGTHAKLLRRLQALGAGRVVFDILFVGPGKDAEGDRQLAAALEDTSSVVGVESVQRFVSSAKGGYFLEELEEPYQPFKIAAEQALVGVIPEGGIVRRFPLQDTEQKRRFPFLAQAAAGKSNAPPAALPGVRDLISYYGAARTIPIVRYSEMLEGPPPLPAEIFKDAVVFVGLLLSTDTGASQKDTHISPFGGAAIYGIEVHATMAANLLDGSWIERLDLWLEYGWQALCAGLFTFLAMSISPLLTAVASVVLVGAWLALTYVALGGGLFIGGAALALVIVPLVLLFSAVYSYAVVRHSEESFRSAFALYLSPEMVSKISGDAKALQLGGEKLWVTALFTDIEDFTRISEEMPAEKVCEMLNAYFSDVMEVVFKNRGTLLKFIGDAVFAIWGAPVVLSNHAGLAIETALEIQRGVERFNALGRFPRLSTRIGIHTGPMLVGNLGCTNRIDYTAIGDAVNLTSRVEGLNRYFGTKILFTEATRRDAAEESRTTSIATVRVKGRREEVKLFTIFDPPLPPDISRSWTRALELFAQADVGKARELFVQAAEGDARLTTASGLYISECDTLASNPPGRGWAGELDFDCK